MPTARTAHSRMDLRPGVPQAPRVHPQPRLVRHSLEERRAPDPVLRARCGLLLQLFSHLSMNPIFRAPRCGHCLDSDLSEKENVYYGV